MHKSPGKKPSGVTVKNNKSNPEEGWAPLSNDDEIEFLRAMEDYQQKHNRPFPTWSEVLGVVRELGYVKSGGPAKKPRESDWAARIAALLEERNHLRLELAEVRKQKAEAMSGLGHLLFGEVPVIDKEALLREAATQPPFAQVVAEIEAELLGKADSHGE
jgi:hypothetical protein